MTHEYRVILADDHRLLRQGIRRILVERSGLQVVGEVGDGFDLLDLLRTVDADLVILDISMPNLRGTEAIPEIKRLKPDMKILVLTMHKDDDFLSGAISAGADGYILKDDAEKDLFSAIDSIRQGRIYISHMLTEKSMNDWAQMLRGKAPLPKADPLTAREREVLKLIAEGKSSRDIGDMLYISVRTVERHRANIMEKLQFRKTADLVRYAMQKGFC